MTQLEKRTIELLEQELIGLDKEYPTEEALYIKNYNTNELIYKPEVFERYVEIYNSLSNE